MGNPFAQWVAPVKQQNKAMKNAVMAADGAETFGMDPVVAGDDALRAGRGIAQGFQNNPAGNGYVGQYAPSAERAVETIPRLRLPSGGTIRRLAGAMGRLPALAGAALGGAALLANPSASQAAETALSFTPANPIAEWANPRGVNDMDEAAAVRNYRMPLQPLPSH